nr:immunoglobulin light chain junction region [Macaca mulatta]MOY08098.1 immunoglobulin light chain junction region [Macaca mulatta]
DYYCMIWHNSVWVF